MPTQEEKLKALIKRMPRAAHRLKQMAEIISALRREEIEAADIPYTRDNYVALKADLGDLLSNIEQPPTETISTEQVLVILAHIQQLDRNLGTAADYAKRLLYGPSGIPEIVLPVTWTQEQKQQLRDKITQALQNAREAWQELP